MHPSEKEKELRKVVYEIVLDDKGLKKFQCHKCPKKFSQRSNIESHMLTVHEGLKEHECDKCVKTYAYKRDLKNHILIVHEDSKNQIIVNTNSDGSGTLNRIFGYIISRIHNH